VAYRLLRHGTVDSTNERAFAALAEGAARNGDVHVAAAQTAGRGRRGATWSSPPDEGLYASVLLLPAEPWHPAALTAAVALALHDALTELGLRGGRVKWPNDLLAGDAKLAGILVETRASLRAAPHYVVGVGVDVAQQAFPAELQRERAVTSLALEGVAATTETVLSAFLRALERRLAQARSSEADQVRDYLAAARLADEQGEGVRVRVEHGGAISEGRLARLSWRGGVELEEPHAAPIPVEHVRALGAL
jgi:biotin-[acetyl-CoA-carboxylase] ligase BirA-like protein